MSAPDLQEQLANLRKAILEGERWLADNASVIDRSETSRQDLRQLIRELQNYSEAAGRKPGVAVFGPSQAGKSTLISALGRGPSYEGLKAEFNGDILDFTSEINEEGGQETTGLVTRFSLAKAPAGPDRDKPVCFRLFSEMDLIKILSNTFLAEGEGEMAEDENTLKQKLNQELQALATNKKQAGAKLTLDELEDLQKYVTGHSAKTTYGTLLTQHFWPLALPLAERNLDIEERATLFSFLWGKLPQFTEIYKLLYKALEDLKFPELAFCGLKVLYDRTKDKNGKDIGREFSVLHVKCLKGLFSGQSAAARPGDQDDPDGPMAVVSDKGGSAILPRPVLCALIAELYIKVNEKPGEFLEHADLLDFPGYRSRKNFGENWQKPQTLTPETLSLCFLRGKVAYLFERFRTRQEISAMLLCIGPSVQESADLPEVIKNWIGESHGKTPAERAGRPVGLFIVLTKFDEHLKEDPSSSDISKRWATRFYASLTDYFSGQDWVENWTKTADRAAPFNNVFWLMNLSFADEWLITEKKNNKACKANGMRPDKEEYLENLRQGYLASDKVQAHICKPDESWEAVVKGEDGGAGFLLKHLNSLLAAPGLQTAQLSNLAKNKARPAAKDKLGPWYRGSGTEAEKQIKRENAEKLSDHLLTLGGPDVGAGDRLFAEFLLELQLKPETCKNMYASALKGESLPQPPANNSAAPENQTGAKPSALKNALARRLGQQSETSPSAQPSIVSNDPANRYRRRLEQEWKDQLNRLAADKDKQKYFKFDAAPELLKMLAEELSQGAQRLNVFEEMETRLRRAASYSDGKPDDLAWKQARLATTVLASYIDWLGFSPREKDREARTITYPGMEGGFELFKPPEPQGRYPELPEEQPDFDADYYVDWSMALGRLMLDNVAYQGVNYDLRQDERLGLILKNIETILDELP